jgi:2-iminobutanoate/2-iminopropanoate deaminase
MRTAALALSLLIATTGCAARSHAPEFIPATGGPVRPFSPAVRANGFIFLAGQLGTDASGQLVAGGIRPQTRQALENIRSLLQRTGASLEQVVKCTVFMADMSEWGTMNEVYTTYFAAGRFPARTAAGASGLALDARVEIECIAVDSR